MIGYRGCYRYVQRARPVPAGARRAGPGARGDPEHRADDPLRAHGLGARGVPRRGRRQPGGRARSRCGSWPRCPRWPTGSRRTPAMGIEGVSIGSNDLTQLMLGVDRDSQICADALRRGRPRRARRHRADHRGLPGLGHHLVAVRPGPVEPAGLRRVPRPPRASRRSRSTPTPSTPCARPWPRPSGACCSRPTCRADPEVGRVAPRRRCRHPGIRATVARPVGLGGLRSPRAPSRSPRRGIPARRGRTPCRSRSRTGSRAPRRPS